MTTEIIRYQINAGNAQAFDFALTAKTGPAFAALKDSRDDETANQFHNP
jgi:hypothetical protein